MNISDLGKMIQESRACFCLAAEELYIVDILAAVELYIIDIREIFVELIVKRVSIS